MLTCEDSNKTLIFGFSHMVKKCGYCVKIGKRYTCRLQYNAMTFYFTDILKATLTFDMPSNTLFILQFK